MVAPLSDVPQESSSVFSLFSLIKLHLASLPLASSYSRVAVSSVFCAQNIFFSAQTRGAPFKKNHNAPTITRQSQERTHHLYDYRVHLELDQSTRSMKLPLEKYTGEPDAVVG